MRSKEEILFGKLKEHGMRTSFYFTKDAILEAMGEYAAATSACVDRPHSYPEYERMEQDVRVEKAENRIRELHNRTCKVDDIMAYDNSALLRMVNYTLKDMEPVTTGE